MAINILDDIDINILHVELFLEFRRVLDNPFEGNGIIIKGYSSLKGFLFFIVIS